jgi:hypothetical protein
LPQPASSQHQALPRRLSFCRDRELNARNRTSLSLEKGWILSDEPFATLCPKQSPDPTAEPENLENALETNFRTLPGLENRGCIPEILFQHPFPSLRKILAPHPTGGTNFPVVLSVRAVKLESLDSDKRASLDSREFASTVPMPKQLHSRLLTLAGCHPA